MIGEQVEIKLQNIFDHPIITRSIIIDRYLENSAFQNQVEKLAFNIINPKQGRLLKSLSNIASGIISKNSKGIGKHISKLKQGLELTSAMQKVVFITEDFIYQFDRSLETLTLPSIKELFSTKLKILPEESNEISHVLEAQNFLKDGLINPEIIFEEKKKKS